MTEDSTAPATPKQVDKDPKVNLMRYSNNRTKVTTVRDAIKGRFDDILNAAAEKGVEIIDNRLQHGILATVKSNLNQRLAGTKNNDNIISPDKTKDDKVQPQSNDKLEEDIT